MMRFIFESKIAGFILQFLEKLPNLGLCGLTTLHKRRRTLDRPTRRLDLFAHLLHAFVLHVVELPVPHKLHESIHENF